MFDALKNVPIVIIKGDTFSQLLANIENSDYSLAVYSNEGSTSYPLPSKVDYMDEPHLMIEASTIYDCISRRRGQLQVFLKDFKDKFDENDEASAALSELETLDNAEESMKCVFELILDQAYVSAESAE